MKDPAIPFRPYEIDFMKMNTAFCKRQIETNSKIFHSEKTHQ